MVVLLGLNTYKYPNLMQWKIVVTFFFGKDFGKLFHRKWSIYRKTSRKNIQKTCPSAAETSTQASAVPSSFRLTSSSELIFVIFFGVRAEL